MIPGNDVLSLKGHEFVWKKDSLHPAGKYFHLRDLSFQQKLVPANSSIGLTRAVTDLYKFTRFSFILASRRPEPAWAQLPSLWDHTVRWPGSSETSSPRCGCPNTAWQDGETAVSKHSSTALLSLCNCSQQR